LIWVRIVKSAGLFSSGINMWLYMRLRIRTPNGCGR
jgi:hypothetical protein